MVIIVGSTNHVKKGYPALMRVLDRNPYAKISISRSFHKKLLEDTALLSTSQ